MLENSPWGFGTWRCNTLLSRGGRLTLTRVKVTKSSSNDYLWDGAMVGVCVERSLVVLKRAGGLASFPFSLVTMFLGILFISI